MGPARKLRVVDAQTVGMHRAHGSTQRLAVGRRTDVLVGAEQAHARDAHAVTTGVEQRRRVLGIGAKDRSACATVATAARQRDLRRDHQAALAAEVEIGTGLDLDHRARGRDHQGVLELGDGADREHHDLRRRWLDRRQPGVAGRRVTARAVGRGAAVAARAALDDATAGAVGGGRRLARASARPTVGAALQPMRRCIRARDEERGRKQDDDRSHAITLARQRRRQQARGLRRNAERTVFEAAVARPRARGPDEWVSPTALRAACARRRNRACARSRRRCHCTGR